MTVMRPMGWETSFGIVCLRLVLETGTRSVETNAWLLSQFRPGSTLVVHSTVADCIRLATHRGHRGHSCFGKPVKMAFVCHSANRVLGL